MQKPLVLLGSIALLIVGLTACTSYAPTTSSNPGASSTQPTTGPVNTQPPQQLPPPALLAQPMQYFLECKFDAFGNYYDPAPTNIVTLDNTQNSVSLDWSSKITDNDPAGKAWASTSPASGTVAAGQQAQVTIIPNPTFCHDLQAIKIGTFNVRFIYNITGQTIQAGITVQVQA